MIPPDSMDIEQAESHSMAEVMAKLEGLVEAKKIGEAELLEAQEAMMNEGMAQYNGSCFTIYRGMDLEFHFKMNESPQERAA